MTDARARPTPDEAQSALDLYQALRAHGETTSASDISKAAGLDTEQAELGLRRLRQLGLVREDGELLEPIEPDAALVTTMAAYRAQTAEQIRSATELEQLTDSLLHVYRPAAAQAAAEIAVEYITGAHRKLRTVAWLTSAARETCYGMHRGPVPTEQRELTTRLVSTMAERGVRIRWLFPRSFLQGDEHAWFLGTLADLGAEVRIIDEAPCNMLLQDRTAACLPADPAPPDDIALLLVRGTALVKTLSAIYEDYWLRATSYERCVAEGTDPVSGDTEPTAQERLVIRLMATGLSDEQIANKMRVSRRTVQRAAAALMDRLNATNRFQAGLSLGQDPQFLRQLKSERRTRN